MDLKQLKALIKLMVENDLTELDVEAEGEKVKLKRGQDNGPVQLMPTQTPTAAAPAPAAVAAVPAAPAAAGPAEDDGLVAITSPMVGTFYSASSPDAKSFVAVGDAIDEDSVVCIIEAMKVFNEIKAELRGTIAKVMVSNGQAVEFGTPLFLVKPA